MSSLLLILLSAVLVNMVALGSVPAWRPFVASRVSIDDALGLALANLAVIVVASVVSWSLSHWMLASRSVSGVRPRTVPA